jgi:uncharacterized RDD family membrane protein YckC
LIEEKYKTFWLRIFAAVIDMVVLIPIGLVSYWVWRQTSDVPRDLQIAWYAFSTLSWYLYEIVLLGKYGQTIGRMLVKVKVMERTETSTITYWQAIKRNSVPVLAILAVMPYQLYLISNGSFYMQHVKPEYDPYTMALSYFLWAWLLAEYITMLFSQKRRAIHDLIAGSVVIRIAPTKECRG